MIVIKIITGIISISIIMIMLYAVAKGIIHVIDPTCKQPALEQLIIAAAIGIVAIVIVVSLCAVIWVLGEAVTTWFLQFVNSMG